MNGGTFDAFSVKEITEKVESIGVYKARQPFLNLVVQGIMAGIFIGLGIVYFMLVQSDVTMSFAGARVLGAVMFSLGLIMVVVTSAELFTGNSMMLIARVNGKITHYELVRNWIIVYIANAIGAMALAYLIFYVGHGKLNDGMVALTYAKTAGYKTSLEFGPAFVKGALANFLVCLAVWLAVAGRSLTDKILAVIFPVSAFIAAGFEHSVANMYLIAAGILMKDTIPPELVAHLPAHMGNQIAHLNWGGFIVDNLIPVTLGNIVGGGVMLAMAYNLIYRPGWRGHERRLKGRRVTDNM